MPIGIPLPRRRLRSLFFVLLVILTPYAVLRHVTSLGSVNEVKGHHVPARRGIVYSRDFEGWGMEEEEAAPRTVMRRPRSLDAEKERPTGATSAKWRKWKRRDSVVKLPEHTYLSNGLVTINPEGGHPIYDLINRAQTEWEAKNRKASKTLDQAVYEYKRRYGRAPPKGFDRW